MKCRGLQSLEDNAAKCAHSELWGVMSLVGCPVFYLRGLEQS